MDNEKRLNLLTRLTEWSFYFLAAGVAFSNSITETATFVIIVSWIMGRALKRDFKLSGGILTPILALFLIWNLASFINTAYIDESIRGLLKVVKHSLLFLATIDHFRSRQKLNKFLLFILGVGFVISLNGIAQYITGTDLIRHRAVNPLDYLRRISSSFRHSNDFGVYLIVINTIFAALFFSRARLFKERIFLLVAALPAAWCMIATYSRGAWLGLIIAMLCLFAIKSRKLLVLILILLAASPLFLPHSIKGRFSDFIPSNNGGTVWERTRLWKGTADMVKAHPILGFGVNTYTKNFPEYKPDDYPDIRYTHNCYLHMAAEIGVVGAGLFITFLMVLLISAARAMKTLERGIYRDLYLGLFAGTIGFLAHSAVDTHFYSVQLAAFLFLCLGLLAAFRNVTYEAT